MGEVFSEHPRIWVSLDRLEYSHRHQVTPDRPHAFDYHITIHNESPRQVKIFGRKWVITNDLGKKSIVEGEGVGIDLPEIAPHSSFHYQSYHLIDRYSEAEGSYLALMENGARIVIRIPTFIMTPPSPPPPSFGQTG